MSQKNRYLIIMHGNDVLYFLDKHGGYTEYAKDALIFSDRYDAQVYIDKHGIERIASVRMIVRKNQD